MNLCSYGCGQEGKYLLKNGKYSCCESYKKCPAVIKRNKEGQQKTKQFKECPYCHKLISYHIGNQYQLHVKSCTYDKNKTMYKAIGDINEDIKRWQNWYNKIIEKRKLNPVIEGYKEKHHIIPKSLGGSNDKSNLIYLTAKEHYICHLLLVRITQNDKIAYKKMLCALFKLGNCNRHYNSNTYKIYREEYIKNCCIGHHNQDGEKNSAWGKHWMSNIELKISKMIKPELIDQYLQEGWIFGNKVWLNNEKKQKQRKEKVIKQDLKKKELINKKQLYTDYYKIYCEEGWLKFKEITNYKYSKQNFVMQCKKYVDEFIPQNGKKRGKKLMRA